MFYLKLALAAPTACPPPPLQAHMGVTNVFHCARGPRRIICASTILTWFEDRVTSPGDGLWTAVGSYLETRVLEEGRDEERGQHQRFVSGHTRSSRSSGWPAQAAHMPEECGPLRPAAQPGRHLGDLVPEPRGTSQATWNQW